jgi:hypothetical protein
MNLSDPAAAWQQIAQNLRRLIKRCTAQGFHVTQDDDFPSFYRLHTLTMERVGGTVYLPEAAFGRYFQTLSSRSLCRLYHAREPSGRVIASQLVLLGPCPVVHTVAAGAEPDAAHTGVSAFLRWRVAEALSALGYQGNDLTDAELNSVTHFKSQLGAELKLSLILDNRHSPRYRIAAFATGLTRAARALIRRASRPL